MGPSKNAIPAHRACGVSVQVLLVDNVCRQHQVSLQSVLHTQLPYLVLRVRRGHLVQDASAALLACQPKELFRPLKVIFDGEEGVDEGGLRREFFTVRLFSSQPSSLRGVFRRAARSIFPFFSSLKSACEELLVGLRCSF